MLQGGGHTLGNLAVSQKVESDSATGSGPRLGDWKASKEADLTVAWVLLRAGALL